MHTGWWKYPAVKNGHSMHFFPEAGGASLCGKWQDHQTSQHMPREQRPRVRFGDCLKCAKVFKREAASFPPPVV